MPIQRIRLAQISASVPETYNHFGQQVDGMNTPKVAVVTATEGQTVFNVEAAVGIKFNKGTKQLQVYLNGQFQQEGAGKAYVEDSDTQITFVEPLMAGDEVVFRIEGVGSGYMNVQQHYHEWREVPAEVPDGVRTEFTLKFIPHEGSEVVFLDGVAMRPGVGNDYTIAGNKITFIRTLEDGVTAAPPAADSNIQVNYVR